MNDKETDEKNSWLNRRRMLPTGKPSFTYCVKVPGPLEGKSLFETHCSLACSTSGTQTECVCVRTHTWIFPTQNSANHVCTSRRERERERERKKCDEELDRQREEEWEAAGGGGKKDFLMPQLLPRQPARQYIQPLPQWHEGIIVGEKKKKLAMSKPHQSPPPRLFPDGELSLYLKEGRNTQSAWNGIQMNIVESK